jgi:hypothetical protein
LDSEHLVVAARRKRSNQDTTSQSMADGVRVVVSKFTLPRSRRRAVCVFVAELDSLCEWQLIGKLIVFRQAAHITLPAIAAVLASAAGVFSPLNLPKAL